MKKVFTSYILIVISTISFSQTIIINSGVTLSKVNWSIPQLKSSLYDTKELSPNFLIDFDYLEEDFFNLSSSIGFMSIEGSYDGGKFSTPINPNIKIDLTQKAIFNYFTFNQGVDIKYKISNRLTPYVFLGGSANFLVSYNSNVELLEMNGSLMKIALGANYGIGVKYFMNNFLYGIFINRYSQINNIAKYYNGLTSPYIISGEAINFNLIFGYKL